MIDLLYYRERFATNSSSDHNAVVLPGGHPDVLPIEDQGFGWEWFVAGSREAKMTWLAQCMVARYRSAIGDRAARSLTHALLGVEAHPEGYVDHQSHPVIPHLFHHDAPDLDYLEEIIRVLSREDVVLLGGHDNTGGPAEEYEELVRSLKAQATRSLVLSVGTDEDDVWVARKEADHWVAFNRDDGRKARVRFGDGGAERTGKACRPRAPELVDVKITARCDHHCFHCYQGSDPGGAHCDMRAVWDLAWACGDAEVFEVSLGGGEPTGHPQFLEILKEFRRRRVVPSFTTARLDWIAKPMGPEILDACGAFAYSVYNMADAEELVAAARVVAKAGQDCAHANIVMGLRPLEGTVATVRHLLDNYVPVTLLGWKPPKRKWAPRHLPHDVSGWVARVGDVARGQTIGIDTALARASLEEIQAAGVPSWLYEEEEGKTSMYVDLVEGKAARCSYAGEEETIEFNRPAGLVSAWEEMA